jgi:hypothetical protein
MNLKRWLSFILMTGLILAINPLSALADPPHRRHRWHSHKHYKHHHKHFRHPHKGPRELHVYHVYEAPPAVSYVTPVNPFIGIPNNQPYYSPPPGLSGQIQYNF